MAGLLRRFFQPLLLPSTKQTFCARTRLFSSEPARLSREEADEETVRVLSAGDPDAENKLRMLMLEVEVARQEGKRAPEPEFMRNQHWESLMALPTRSARLKYLVYLFKTNMSKNNRKAAKEENYQQYLKNKAERSAQKEAHASEEDAEETAIKYDLSHNSMFLRIYEKSVNELYNRKMLQATQFGQKLIFDCSYDKYMVPRECKFTSKQLTLVFASNRVHDAPWDIHLCNCDMSGLTMKNLNRSIPPLLEADFPMHVHADSYMNHFPPESLVYLTPHCRNDLVYDPNDTYIVGCMVDKVNPEPLSLAKAKENKLRMARLPLDKYLQWGGGSGKSLTINQMCDILLDMGLTQDWEYALRHVPRRKLGGPIYSSPSSKVVDKLFAKRSPDGYQKPLRILSSANPKRPHDRQRISRNKSYYDDD